MLEPYKIAFISEVFPDMQKTLLVKKYGLSPEMLTAWAAIESNYGKNRIGKYNIWGVKAGPTWKGKVINARTFEYFNGEKVYLNSNFKDYNSKREAYEDHFSLLTNSRYAPALQYKDEPFNYIRSVISLGYATANPEIYASAVQRHIENVNEVKPFIKSGPGFAGFAIFAGLASLAIYAYFKHR